MYLLEAAVARSMNATLRIDCATGQQMSAFMVDVPSEASEGAPAKALVVVADGGALAEQGVATRCVVDELRQTGARVYASGGAARLESGARHFEAMLTLVEIPSRFSKRRESTDLVGPVFQWTRACLAAFQKTHHSSPNRSRRRLDAAISRFSGLHWVAALALDMDGNLPLVVADAFVTPTNVELRQRQALTTDAVARVACALFPEGGSPDAPSPSKTQVRTAAARVIAEFKPALQAMRHRDIDESPCGQAESEPRAPSLLSLSLSLSLSSPPYSCDVRGRGHFIESVYHSRCRRAWHLSDANTLAATATRAMAAVALLRRKSDTLKPEDREARKQIAGVKGGVVDLQQLHLARRSASDFLVYAIGARSRVPISRARARRRAAALGRELSGACVCVLDEFLRRARVARRPSKTRGARRRRCSGTSTASSRRPINAFARPPSPSWPPSWAPSRPPPPPPT